MCGIFGVIGTEKNSAHIVFEGLRKLEYRGYDSFGIYAKTSDGKPFLLKKTGAVPHKEPKLPESYFALGHTRWATHGGVTVANAHPHTDCHRSIFVVHNGIVENMQELKKELIRKRHHFGSSTDTEIIPHLIESFLKDNKDPVEATRQAFLKLEGLNAIIAAFPEENLFVCAKNTSPITIGKKGNTYYFASDPNALSTFTHTVHFLEDQTIVAITKKDISLYDVDTKKPLSCDFIEYEPVSFSHHKNPHAHLMLKEIYEQPDVIKRIIHHTTSLSPLEKALKTSYGAYLIGAGSAGFAGLFGTYIFSKIGKRHVNFSPASEFAYIVDFLTPRSLVIALSQSGETEDTISAVKAAQKKGSTLAAITNVFSSTLYRLCPLKILLEAGQEQCVLATKSFMAKLTVLMLLAASFHHDEKIHMLLENTADEMIIMKEHNYLEAIQQSARVISQAPHVLLIGRGAQYPLALEGALKIKEGSYVHAEGLAGGELKHGPIALIEKGENGQTGTPCIVLAASDETYTDTISNAEELKSRGAYIIGIGSKKHPVFDQFLTIKDISHGSYLLATYVLQLLGYYTAVLRGVNPDRPRNLAKSVTVK